MTESTAPAPAADTRTPRRPGTPCWIDLTTHDLEGAKTFYRELFDWELTDTGERFGHYHLARRGEHVVAGLMTAMAPDGSVPDPSEAPSMWSVYLATEDAEATAAQVTEAGGQVMFPPMGVEGLGVMSFAIDPSGAPVGFWQAAPFTGFDTPLLPGTPVWFEAMTTGFDASAAFYRSVFGWDVAMMPGSEEGGFRYATNGAGEAAASGLCDASAMFGEGGQGYWRAYIRVEDCDAAGDRVRELGGAVLDGPMDSPFGRVATIADPAGASLQIIDTERRG